MVLDVENANALVETVNLTGRRRVGMEKEIPMVKVRVTTGFYVKMTPHAVGEIIELPSYIAAEMISANRCVLYEEPPKVEPNTGSSKTDPKVQSGKSEPSTTKDPKKKGD